MENKLKIKISETAYTKIMELLFLNKEYECVRFSYSSGCCKSPKVSILLDTMDKNNITIDKIDKLNIIYDKSLTNKIREIQLIYRNNEFAVKALPRDGSFSCNNTHGDNSSCGSSCSKCNKSCK